MYFYLETSYIYIYIYLLFLSPLILRIYFYDNQIIFFCLSWICLFQIDLFVLFNDNILQFCGVNFDRISGFLLSDITSFSNPKLQHSFLKYFFFADLSATLSNTFCWECFDWSVDKEVLLSDELMYFYLLLCMDFFVFVKEITV